MEPTARNTRRGSGAIRSADAGGLIRLPKVLMNPS